MIAHRYSYEPLESDIVFTFIFIVSTHLNFSERPCKLLARSKCITLFRTGLRKLQQRFDHDPWVAEMRFVSNMLFGRATSLSHLVDLKVSVLVLRRRFRTSSSVLIISQTVAKTPVRLPHHSYLLTDRKPWSIQTHNIGKQIFFENKT